MKIAPLAEVKTKLSAYVEQAEKEGPIVITRNGKPVAVIIAPVSDDDLENLILARSARFQAMLDRSRKSLRAGKGVTAEQLWKSVNEKSSHKDK